MIANAATSRVSPVFGSLTTMCPDSTADSSNVVKAICFFKKSWGSGGEEEGTSASRTIATKHANSARPTFEGIPPQVSDTAPWQAVQNRTQPPPAERRLKLQRDRHFYGRLRLENCPVSTGAFARRLPDAKGEKPRANLLQASHRYDYG